MKLYLSEPLIVEAQKLLEREDTPDHIRQFLLTLQGWADAIEGQLDGLTESLERLNKETAPSRIFYGG